MGSTGWRRLTTTPLCRRNFDAGHPQHGSTYRQRQARLAPVLPAIHRYLLTLGGNLTHRSLAHKLATLRWTVEESHMRCTTTQCHSTCRPSSYTHARYSHPQRSNPPHNHMCKSPRPPNNYVMHEQAPPEPHTLNMSTQRRCTSHPQQNTSEHCPLHSSRTQKNNHSNKRHPHTMTPTHPPEPPDRHMHYTPTLSHSTNRPHHYTHAQAYHRKHSSPHRTLLCTATPPRHSSVTRDSAGVVPCTGSTPGRCQTTTHQSRHTCGLWSLRFDSIQAHNRTCTQQHSPTRSG